MTPHPNQAALVRDAKKGDREAFAELAAHYLQPLYATCCFVTRNRDRAEDAVQETFLTALERLDELRDERALGWWLLRIARNQCLERIRKDARFAGPSDDDDEPDPPDPGPTPEQEVLDDEEAARARAEARRRRALAWRLVWTVSEAQREVVFYHIWFGLAFREIGLILNKKEGAVRKANHDGMETMRKKVREWGDTK